MIVQKYLSNSGAFNMKCSYNCWKILPFFAPSSKIQSNIQEPSQHHEDDFFKSIKGLLIFGKLIGVLPFSGIFGNSSKDLSFRNKSFSAMISYGISVVLIFNVLVGSIDFIQKPKRNALQISQSIRLSAFNVWGCLIYITFLYKSQMFLRVFKVWNSINVKYSRKDKTLRRDISLIAGCILASAILENMVLHLEYIKELDTINGNNYGDRHKNMTTLEAYYWRANETWAAVIGYNWFFAVLAFLHHKWILYAWNYMDILIAVFGRATFFRFKCLYEEAEKKLIGSQICQDPNGWSQVIYDHQNLCRLLGVLESFFSPMVFGSYLINILYICVQLQDDLTSELSKRSVVHSIYATWSFLHLVIRTFTVSICCAYINLYAHKIRNILQQCPPKCYSKDVSRAISRVTEGPAIGLTGLECFTITKPFILGLISVVFTFEIVLLQCVP